MLPTHVATLVAARTAPVLDTALIAKARSVLTKAGEPTELDPGLAVELPFAGADPIPLAEQRLRETLGSAPVDIVVQEAEGRRKSLFLADMDSTMIGQECIDELADLVGLKAHVSAITERAMRGEIAFEPALRERVALLAGLSETVVEDVIRNRISLTPGGRQLVLTMRAHGARTALVSGGFTLFTARIAEMIGFGENHANILEVEGGRLTGRVAEPILGKEAKRETLIRLREAANLPASATMAVGDGANDLAMLGEAGMGVAFRAKPAVAAAARMRIDHADLTALLFAQGYAAAEFVND